MAWCIYFLFTWLSWKLILTWLILLELPKLPEFSFIGAARSNDKWTVQKRPFTFNMNWFAQFSNVPRSIFSQQRFDNAADYFKELARQHFHVLELQRNDAWGFPGTFIAGKWTNLPSKSQFRGQWSSANLAGRTNLWQTFHVRGERP